MPSRPASIALPQPTDAGVSQDVLVARQIRLYIENAPVLYPLAVIMMWCVLTWLLRPHVSQDRAKLALWFGLIVGTAIVRLAAWMLFSRAQPGDRALRPWVKWFFGPQLLSMLTIAASPFLFLPGAPGQDHEIILILTFFIFTAGLAGGLKLSAYRPLIAVTLVPTALIYAAGMLRVDGLFAPVSALGAVVVCAFGYLATTQFNRALVRSMELTMHNQHLVAALEARTAQLEEQRFAAESAVLDKTRFLAAASHDLRQPMHAISLLVGMLRPRASGAEREVAERLERAVESMDDLFNAILDLSKLDAGVVKPLVAEFPLRAIFDSIEVHFAPQAGFKKLGLEVFPSRAIVATDRAVLERLLRNLVSNAIKYTHEGKVLVGCRRRGDRLRIAVWDTGVGIATENLKRIFEEYFQAEAGPRNRSDGLGLGLSIVKRLAALLGSKVEVSSAPGRGSRFELEVAFAGYARADARAGTAESAPEEALEGKYILVVDDEPDVRFGAEALLKRWGCRCASAGSLEEVEALLDRDLRFPDALVTDFRLAGRHTGLDVIAAVRRYSGERTPAVVVTGEDLGKAEMEHEGEFYPIVRKPLAAEELRRRLVAMLRLEALRTS